jgi:DNA polymerase-3 subunit epsilon
MGTSRGLAVLDLETTGFGFKSGDRIVEIGVVLLDQQLEIMSTWSTLVNPERDPGPIGVHGIRDDWLEDAPLFEEIFHDLGSLLEGNAIVAHNAGFDFGFLEAEMRRIGAWSNIYAAAPLCTLRLAKGALTQLDKHRLGHLAYELGLKTQPNHSALADALTTAELLKFLHNQYSSVRSEVHASTSFESDFRKYAQHSRQKSRPQAFSREVLFEEMFRNLPPSGNNVGIPVEYLEVLENVIQSPDKNEVDLQSIYRVAEQFGVGLDDAKAAHLELFTRLVHTAWADNRLTPRERADLEFHANLLGISPSVVLETIENSAPGDALPYGLKPGDSVVLTGEMIPPKSVLAHALSKHGIEVKTSVSGRTSMVIAADTSSLSGKAKRARELGIPIYSASEVFASFSKANRRD